MDVKIWLRTVLQHYAEPDRTFRDVDAVLQMYFTSLKPKVENYTYNDGRSEMLLCLYGTVPITYRSIPYNIPIAFYIPIEYPHEPPIPYVKPTVNMLVREGKHVDKSGLCYHPYRSSWTEDVNKHTLLELVAILQQVFSQEPPVYTKPDTGASPMLSHVSSSSMPGIDTPTKHRSTTSPPPPTPPPPPPPPPVTTSSTSTPSQTYSPSMKSDTPRWAGDGTAYYNIHQGLASMALSPTSYTPTPPPMPSATTSTGHPVQKSASVPTVTSSPIAAKNTIARPHRPERELQDKVYRKVAERMQAFNLAVSNEMDKLLAINRQLNDGEARIAQEQYTLQDMVHRLQSNIRVLESRESDIDQVIKTVNAMPDIAVDEALCGTTVVYNQMFDLVADDNAIVDTIYYLGKALNSERIDLVTFMKCTRTLAREQFMKRALLKKIMESQ